jgi:hypothetical protein
MTLRRKNIEEAVAELRQNVGGATIIARAINLVPLLIFANQENRDRSYRCLRAGCIDETLDGLSMGSLPSQVERAAVVWQRFPVVGGVIRHIDQALTRAGQLCRERHLQ